VNTQKGALIDALIRDTLCGFIMCESKVLFNA